MTYTGIIIKSVKRRGARIRLITEITRDNIHYCKKLIKIVDELRHLDDLIGGIAVSETEYMTTTSLHKGTLLTQVFYSNAVEVVKQGKYVFLIHFGIRRFPLNKG